MKKGLLGALLGLSAMFVLLGGCAPPTAEQACKAAGDRFNACSKTAADKWEWKEQQYGSCKSDFEASTMKDYTKTLKKCSEMDECDISQKCMTTILLAVSNDAKKNKK